MEIFRHWLDYLSIIQHTHIKGVNNNTWTLDSELQDMVP